MLTRERTIRLSGLACIMAIKKPPMKHAKPASHKRSANLLTHILIKVKNMDKIRKMKSGGRSRMMPNKKRLKSNFFMPAPTNENPNLK